MIIYVEVLFIISNNIFFAKRIKLEDVLKLKLKFQ